MTMATIIRRQVLELEPRSGSHVLEWPLRPSARSVDKDDEKRGAEGEVEAGSHIRRPHTQQVPTHPWGMRFIGGVFQYRNFLRICLKANFVKTLMMLRSGKVGVFPAPV